jgi:hypothetical protein
VPTAPTRFVERRDSWCIGVAAIDAAGTTRVSDVGECARLAVTVESE